ncbi:hypothetical protein R3P38DRAFT_2799954 [Favolaschia claudopus]|uniref:SWIM-type domain-containing protein n=1 Tax=Favolaschia claudopus TaxID=2862362 RepID=A0AAV9ZZJ6_9AGAR
MQVTGVNQYRVKSQSKRSCVYVVDISAYTCTCLDYPLISYCKHIAAGQTLFKEVVTTTVLPGTNESPSSDPASTNEEVDSSSDTVSHSDSSDDEPPYPHQIQPPPTTRNLTLLARRLDTLAARLRHSRKQELSFPSLAAFESALDDLLKETDSGSILPVAQHIAPCRNEWLQTRKSMGVMPRVKTKARKTGDQAYGAGARSGLKAKKAKVSRSPASTPESSQLPSLPTPSPDPLVATPPLLLQAPVVSAASHPPQIPSAPSVPQPLPLALPYQYHVHSKEKPMVPLTKETMDKKRPSRKIYSHLACCFCACYRQSET